MTELSETVEKAPLQAEVGRARPTGRPPNLGTVETGHVEESPETRPELSVVVPVYNEGAVARRALETLRTVVDSLVDSFEIIVVDDGSDDSTSTVLRAMADTCKRIQFLKHETNHGKGHALKTGCRAVRGERVLFVDGDGDVDPVHVQMFLEEMESGDADIVIGSKRHPESNVEYPFVRTVLSRGYSLLVRGLFRLDVTDTQVGMKLLHREVIDEVMPMLLVQRYACDVELLAVAVDRGYSVTEVPVSIEFDEDSHINWKTVFSMGWDTAAVFYRHRLEQYYDGVSESNAKWGD